MQYIYLVQIYKGVPHQLNVPLFTYTVNNKKNIYKIKFACIIMASNRLRHGGKNV